MRWTLVVVAMAALAACGVRLNRNPKPPPDVPLVIDLSAGAGAGRVRSSPLGLDCDLRPGTTYACDRKFPKGTRVMISAAADPTSYFAGWSGDCQGRGYCLITLDRPRRVLASFQRPGGDYHWGRRLGGRAENIATAIAPMASGDTIVAGVFQNTIEFSTGKGGELLSRGNNDIFVAKLKNGRAVWARSYGGPGDDGVIAVGVTASGQIAITGWFDQKAQFDHVELESRGFRDAFVAFLDDSEAGPSVRMIDQLGSAQSDSSQRLAVVGDTVYVTGNFGAPAAPGSGTAAAFAGLPHRGAADVFVLAYAQKSGGDWGLSWARAFGGKERDQVYGLAASDAGVVLAGAFEDTLLLDPGGPRGGPAPAPAATPGNPAGPASAAAPPAAGKGKDKGKDKKKPDKPKSVTAPAGGGGGGGGRNRRAATLPDDPVSAGRGDGFVIALSPDGAVRWVSSYGGTGSDGAYGVAMLGDEVVLAGSFDKTLDLAGTKMTSEAYGVFLARYGSGGTLLASSLVGHQPIRNFLRLEADSARGLLLAGNLPETVSGSGRRDYTVTRFKTDDNKFTVDWSRRVRPVSEREGLVQGYGIAVDDARHVYLAGTLSGKAEFQGWGSISADAAYDVWFAKLDPQGRYHWLTGSSDRGEDIGRAVARTPEGGIVVTGSFKDNIGDRRMPVSGATDAFVTLLSKDGMEQDTRTLGGTGFDAGRGVAASAAGIVVVGNFQDSAGMASPLAPLLAAGQYDAFVAWYSDKLDPLAAFALGGPRYDDAAAVAMADDGTTYVAATLSGAIMLGQAENGPLALDLGDRPAAVLVKYGPTRRIEWVRKVTGDGKTGQASSGALALTGKGQVVWSGWFNDKVTVGEGGRVLESAGGADAFVARFDGAGALSWALRWGADTDDRSPAVAVNDGGEVVLGVNVRAGAKSPPGTQPRAMLVWLTPAGALRDQPLRAAKTPCAEELHALSLVGTTVVVAGNSRKLDFKSGETTYCLSRTDAFLSKVTQRRRLVWERSYGGDGDDDACGVVRRERRRTAEELAQSRAKALRSLELAEEDDEAELVSRGGVSMVAEDTVVVGNFGGAVKFGGDADPQLTSIDNADVFIVELDL